jgi:aminoglycoside phosphotransferase (APT) family kinase protein
MTTDESAAVDLREAKEMARQLIAHHFGNKPKRIVHMASGLTNFVFLVYHPEGDFIVRISPEATKVQVYMKEQWAVVQAREIGVPTVEILEVGNQVVPAPYMISRRVIGQESTFHPNRLQILRDMGRQATLINSIPTTGFGSTFDWSGNQLSRNETWREYLDKELQVEARLETLKKYRMLAPKDLKTLRSICKDMAGWKPEPSLNHGDLRLKNVIVNEAGEITAIIDWEDCVSSVSPHWDLSIALHDLSIDEKQEFLEGYALPEKKLIEVAPFIKALNLSNYVPEIERLADAKEALRLEQYKTRLSGALDLYSL